MSLNRLTDSRTHSVDKSTTDLQQVTSQGVTLCEERDLLCWCEAASVVWVTGDRWCGSQSSAVQG
jgi:hypothetical protein